MAIMGDLSRPSSRCMRTSQLVCAAGVTTTVHTREHGTREATLREETELCLPPIPPSPPPGSEEISSDSCTGPLGYDPSQHCRSCIRLHAASIAFFHVCTYAVPRATWAIRRAS